MAIDIGRIAYQKYSDHVSGYKHVTKYRQDLPKWEDVGQIGQDAWRAAACAVLEYIDKEREQYEKDKAEDKEADRDYF